MFTCPQCKIDLWKKQGPSGVFWVCPTCDGRTSTISMLRKTVPSADINKIWQTLMKSENMGSRKCPSCNRFMSQVHAPGKVDTNIVDVCKGCQFLWFDPGEHEALPRLPNVDPNPVEKDLPMAAREAMAEADIQVIKSRYEKDESFDNDPGPLHSIAGLLGLPVESDGPTLSNWPVVTWITSLIIVIVSLLSFPDLRGVIDELGLVPADPARHFGLTLVTSFFLHGGVFHLIGNVYFLIVFGDNVEDVMGRLKFTFLLIAAALIGDSLHILGEPESMIPCIGASGGISGVLAYYALRFPHARVSIMVRTRCAYDWLKLPAFVLFIIWILIQLIGAKFQMEGLTNVSYLAHLGGAGTGFVLYFLTKDTR